MNTCSEGIGNMKGKQGERLSNSRKSSEEKHESTSGSGTQNDHFNINSKGYMRTDEVASYAGVSSRTVRKWLKQGLRHLRISHKMLLFRKEWVDEFLLRHERSDDQIENFVNEILATI